MTTITKSKGNQREAKNEYGIVSTHAYTIMKVVKTKSGHLIKLRNPWGK